MHQLVNQHVIELAIRAGDGQHDAVFSSFR
jgi:hypothetical protein